MATIDTPWVAGTMKQRCDVFRLSTNPNTDGRGKPGGRVWSKVGSNLPYFHLSTRNFSQPSVIGRMLQPSSISVEFGYFLPDAPLQDQDVIRDVTPNGALNGTVYRVMGAKTEFDAIPVDDAAYSYVELRQEPHPPADLPV